MTQHYYATIYRRDFKGLRGCPAESLSPDKNDYQKYNYDPCLFKPMFAPDKGKCTASSMDCILTVLKRRNRSVYQVSYTPGKLELSRKPIEMMKSAKDASFAMVQKAANDNYCSLCHKAIEPLLSARRLYGLHDYKLWHTGLTEYDRNIGCTGWQIMKCGYKNDAALMKALDNDVPTLMH